MVKPGARDLPKLALDILTALERREAQLLCWGMVDGYFTYEEVIDVAQDRLTAALNEGHEVPYSADDVLGQLKGHLLLFQLPGPERGRYRTRTAEAVRLFFRLKQLFEGNSGPGEWRNAKDLVADFRLILRARQYPKRHITPDAVLERVGSIPGFDDLSNAVVKELLTAGTSSAFLLADFQTEAAEHILRSLSGDAQRGGTIVCAGTGSGKTLAFYLPALVQLAQLASAEDWTRCLAIYPRNELLKDQLDSALAQVAALNRVLVRHGRPRVTVGALYGAVPSSCEDENRLKRTWSRPSDTAIRGWLCPYVRCPNDACDQRQLVWLDTDRLAKRERLCCPSPNCDHVLDESMFRLTRSSLNARPPDVLFSGLEMVNQSMSSLATRRLLGIGIDQAAQRPRLVLLDEVHTYSGAYGAQAALLLRRWRYASRSAPHFVGLSATLEDAPRFFGELIGEPESRVKHIYPRASDLEEDGQEVLLALRGDPVSKTSLLSTSIQSAMLLRRVLDPKGTRKSLVGTKVFAFTDDLDVTNRLYHTLLDAEGWRTRFNRPPIKDGLPLASLRHRDRDDEHLERFTAGQSWDLVQDIGHELADQATVHIGRTSSQDAGVDSNSETVVATASLEVGFDDPDVGAVLQHKAPRDAASFLQRKGRAGRPRGTRPWTVVVLSDYGRDRLAYQGYEQLFSPELRPRYLPIRNRHVLRIQATLALVDWLAEGMGRRFGDTSSTLWATLSQPPKQDRYFDTSIQRLERVQQLVERLMSDDADLRRFGSYLGTALDIDRDTADQLLWAPPRSLMLSVLPTLRRRLDRRWQVATSGEGPASEPHTFWSPLPEFLPNALFSDLNLPEVTIRVPPYGEHDVERMPIVQALREFAPGRVSRRFGTRGQGVQHWVRVPPSNNGSLDIETFCRRLDGDDIGPFRYLGDMGESVDVACIRPRVLCVQEPEMSVKPTSNGFLHWKSQLLPRTPAAPAELPFGSPWRCLIKSVGFHGHNYGNAIQVRRFALGSSYEIKTQRHGDHIGRVAFERTRENGPEAVALGFELDADAMRLELVFPEELHRKVQTSEPLLGALRTARFRHLVLSSAKLEGIANRFQREWLCQMCLSALLLAAATEECSLVEAAERVFEQGSWIPLERVLDVIFQVTWDVQDVEDGNEETRANELRDLVRDAMVREVLRESASDLWANPTAEWDDWLGERYAATLGAAILDACQQLCPEVDSGDLCLDVDPGPRGPSEGCRPREQRELWLTETSPGGSGVVEAVSEAYARNPLRFFQLVEAALAPSDFEEIDSELGTLISWLSPRNPSARPGIQAAVRACREAETHEATVLANEKLRGSLEEAGLAVTHPVLVAMQARVLRPGSTVRTDEMLDGLLTKWKSLEDRLGVEVDARVIAYALSEDSDLSAALDASHSHVEHRDTRDWRYGALYSLLWPRGSSVRSQALSVYNPFCRLEDTDRLLVLAVHADPTTDVGLEHADWAHQLKQVLAQEGAATLSAPPGSRQALRKAILQTLAQPIETAALLVAPILSGVTHEGRRLRARFDVQEDLQ